MSNLIEFDWFVSWFETTQCFSKNLASCKMKGFQILDRNEVYLLGKKGIESLVTKLAHVNYNLLNTLKTNNNTCCCDIV